MFGPDNSNTGNTAATRGNSNGNSFEKATGFLNFYLPTAGGGRVKVGSIPCRESDKTQKAVLDHLRAAKDEAEFEERLKTIFNKMALEFNFTEGKAVELAL